MMTGTIRNPENTLKEEYCAPECSLFKPPVGKNCGWIRMVYVFTEGMNHPLPLGYAGDCAECLDGLRTFADSFPFTVEEIDNPSGDPDFHPECPLCNHARRILDLTHG